MNKGNEDGQNSVATSALNANPTNLYSLQAMAYNTFLNMYANCKQFDKYTNINCLAEESRYTFADDMVVYLMNPQTAEKEIDKYVERMLKRHCHHNSQAYFELILSTELMANFFNELGYEDLGECCANWRDELFFEEDTICKYISMDDISKLWALR